jgi:very-short-patch-repair endonuclease
MSIPRELRADPFTVADARGAGLTWESLQTRSWRRMSRGQYAWTGLRYDVELMLRAAHKRLPDRAAFSGRTAGWIHGLDVPPCEPIEVTIPRDVPIRTRAGVRLRRASLLESDLAICRGFRVTTPLRTAIDLGSCADLVEATVAVDMALHARIVDLRTLHRYVDSSSGTKGIKRLRRAVDLAEPRSESPMETRLRMELIKGRLPKPEVQVDLHDHAGRFLARADLYYGDVRLLIEFDGQHHTERLVPDLRRQNGLLNAGYHILRFTAADLKTHGAVASQVRKTRSALLRKAG